LGNEPANKATAVSEDDTTTLPNNSTGEAAEHTAPGFVQSTVILTISSIVRIAIVLAQQTVLAAMFGARMEMDAFLAATTIPTLIMGVLIEQLNVTLIPIVVKYKVKDGSQESVIVISSLINLAFIVLGILSVIGIGAGDLIVRLTVPGFGAGNPTSILTTRLFRLLLPSVIFSGLAGLLTGVFYAGQRYLVTSVASITNSLLALIITLEFVRYFGIASAAVGLLAGSFVQFAILFGALLKDRKYRFRLNLSHPGLIKVIRLTLPLIGGAIFYKASPAIDRFIASGLPEGSIAFLGYAFRIVNTLLILVTQGIAVAFFPILSRCAASDDIEEMKRILFSGIEVLTFVIAPIATALAIFGKPSVQLLLERGAFTNEATIGTTAAMLCYLGYLFAGTIGSIQTYTLYALQDTTAILKVAAIAVILEIVLSLSLSRVFGFPGLAVSLSVVTMVSMTLFAFIIRRRLKSVANNRMLISQSKVWFSCFIMATVSLGSYYLLSKTAGIIGGGFAIRASTLLLSATTGLACYLAIAWLLKCGGMFYFLKGFNKFRNVA
jgi:putative peptidoglycan lipid II flippase